MSSASDITHATMSSKPPGEKWLFTEEQLENTPSRRENVTAAKELNYRQQAANLIQDMGQRLPVNQLTINTAIVYMHRFYMFHSFPAYSRFAIAPAALFLAAKVEEQPRKLEHVLRVCQMCLQPEKTIMDVHSENYMKQAQQLVEHELIMLQTLGFDISIDHPHTHVVKCTQLVKASRDLSQMAYFMATNSLHLTTFCLKYKPTVVSAMCIHLSCKWSNYEIPLSSEGKAYWSYMDPTITESMLDNIITEFLRILNLCPTRLRKLKNYRPSSRDGSGGSTLQSRDSHHHKPTTSKVPHGAHPNSRLSADAPNSEQKKTSTSLTIAQYKHKREKQQQQQHQSNSRPDGSLRQSHDSAKGPHLPHGAKPSDPAKGPHLSRGVKPSDPVKGAHLPHVRPASATPDGHSSRVEGSVPKHMDKAQPKLNSHKKPDGFKPHQGQMMPGLQKHRPSHQPSPHGPGQHELNKMQSQQRSHSNAKMPPPPPPPKTKELPKEKEKPASVMNKSSSSSQPPKPNDTKDPVLAGLEQKISDRISADKAKEVPKPPNNLPQNRNEQYGPMINPKDHKNRHSLPNMPLHSKESSSHSMTVQSLPKTYEGLYELYKKNPDHLRHQIKLKAQIEPLSEVEKQIWHKLKKKEEEKQNRKRKHEKHRLHKSHPGEATGDGLGMSAGGPLTVRIKIPQPPKLGGVKNQTNSSMPNVASNSGSESGTLSPPSGTAAKAGRKRSHSRDPAQSAKHLKKDNHSNPSHSSSNELKHRHKHNRSNTQHSKPHQPGSKIDEATFQQALTNAVSMVQSGQAAATGSTGRIVPPVTLKKAEAQNGSGDNYVAHSSKQDRSSKPASWSKPVGFDPSAPISTAPPENLFEAESVGRLKPELQDKPSSKNPELSSPEVGEIVDDEEDEDEARSHVSRYTSNFAGYGQRHNYHQGGNSHRNIQPYSHNARQDQHRAYDNNAASNLVSGNTKRSDQR